MKRQSPRYKGEIEEAANRANIHTAGVERELTLMSTVASKALRDFDRRDGPATLKGVQAILATAKKLEAAVKAIKGAK